MDLKRQRTFTLVWVWRLPLLEFKFTSENGYIDEMLMLQLNRFVRGWRPHMDILLVILMIGPGNFHISTLQLFLITARYCNLSIFRSLHIRYPALVVLVVVFESRTHWLLLLPPWIVGYLSLTTFRIVKWCFDILSTTDGVGLLISLAKHLQLLHETI